MENLAGISKAAAAVNDILENKDRKSCANLLGNVPTNSELLASR